MPESLVSIIIPSFNQGRYIRDTIDSVLAQDYRPLELLVFDGGSTDETVAVLESYGSVPELRWWSEPDRGVVDAVNKGLQQAQGVVVGIQSSDDLYLPGAVSSVMDVFARDASLALVYGDAEYIDSDGVVLGGTSLLPFDLGDYVGKLSFIPQSSAFFARAVAKRVGPWRAEVSYAADAEFFLRIVARSRAVKIERTLSRYRYHESQRDRAGERVAYDWEQAIRSWLGSEHPVARLRRQALAGVHLTRAHYLSDSQWLRRTLELYRAVWRSPRVALDPSFPMRELIPGRAPLWRALSRLKQALGFRPRGG